MIILPGGEILTYTWSEGDTYEIALLSFRIIPDLVIILHRGVSLPQDKPIEEDEVEIILTAGLGCGTGWWQADPSVEKETDMEVNISPREPSHR